MEHETIKISPMLFPEDKDEINTWTAKYWNTPEYQLIHTFIMENDTYLSLGEVINTNHEIFAIGDDEKKYAFTAKSKDNEIVAWILLDVFNLTTKNPEMFLQYIVINPKYQHKGYGTKIAKEIFLTPENYVKVKPKSIFAYVDVYNLASINLFSKFNFEFSQMEGTTFFKAHTNNVKYLETQKENYVFNHQPNGE